MAEARGPVPVTVTASLSMAAAICAAVGIVALRRYVFIRASPSAVLGSLNPVYPTRLPNPRDKAGMKLVNDALGPTSRWWNLSNRESGADRMRAP